MVGLRTEVEGVNVERRRVQERGRGEMEGLERGWREGVGRVLEVEAAGGEVEGRLREGLRGGGEVRGDGVGSRGRRRVSFQEKGGVCQADRTAN